MRVFSGRYPRDLGKVIAHAKRMKDLLEELEGVRTGDAWFLGRAGELRGVVALAVKDWRHRTIDEDAARRAILSHVDDLHRGASRRLRCGLPLDCCEADDAITLQGLEDAESAAETDTGTTGPSRPTNGPTVPAGWEDRPEVLARFREGYGLVEVHARSLARTVRSGSPTMDDLRGFGREGLLIAARSYDDGRGVPFEKWATVRIRNTIIDGIRSWGAVRARTHETRAPLAVAGSEQGGSDGQAGSQQPGACDVGEAFGGAFVATMAAAPGVVDGLQAPCATPEELLAKAQLESTVRVLVGRLTGRERTLIERVYFQGHSLEGTAESMGVTRAWARRLHDRVLERIQEELSRREAVGAKGNRCGRERS